MNVNQIYKLANYFYKIANASNLEWVKNAQVPAEPGTTIIPSTHVRFYHYTAVNYSNDSNAAFNDYLAANSIRENGLQIGKAKGNTYGEPNLVWASAEKPGDFKVYAEFSVSMDDERWILGKPDSVSEEYSKFTLGPGKHYNVDPSYYHKHGSNVGFNDSIRPEEIIAVHEPWHHRYRYILNNKELIKEIIEGELDHLLKYPDYGPAIQKIKYEN